VRSRGKVRTLGVSAAALFVFGLASAPHAAAESLVASCEPPANTSSSGWEYVAQTDFTPERSGPLTRAELEVHKVSGSGDYRLQLRTVDGVFLPGAVLARAKVDDAAVPLGTSVISASFSAPVEVQEGQKYALSVHRATGLEVSYFSSNACSNGNAAFSDDGGATWDDFAGAYDMVFRVFTGTPRCKGVPATIFGTAGGDTLVGTPGGDVIAGLGGNDTIRGLGEKDRLCGNKGQDKLKGGGGKDFLKGAKGNDALNGGRGRDECVGGPGADTAKKCELERSI
jgi:hypothetical protein